MCRMREACVECVWIMTSQADLSRHAYIHHKTLSFLQNTNPF
ncbi:hypothetical protein CSUI_006089 [Cystoisospora suis]|uniref:C2H2-type domain-containing protein n=1 Tax=Cystoisospora suis TaxID=483139 RepID=A0A2C6KHV5_9APIC|nr:hypothetical protein CSUI_006089 [Cystoisospora suis]